MRPIGLCLSAGAGSTRWWPADAVYAADFANGRYMRNGVEVPETAAYSFSRNSPAAMLDANGNWQTFAPGVLRRIAGIGALIEPAATNQSRGTNAVGGGGWSALPPQLTPTIHGDGSFTLTVNQPFVGHLRVEQYGYINVPANEPGYFAFDLHDSGMRGAAVWFSDVGYRADFDTATGVATGHGATDTATMEAIGDGWWRCKIGHIQTLSTTAWRIKLGKNRSDTNYVVSEFVRFRAPQVELMRHSSYFANPSSVGPATRQADVFSLLLAANPRLLTIRYADGQVQNLAMLDGSAALDPAELHSRAIVMLSAA